jgi:hypothetical protein
VRQISLLSQLACVALALTACDFFRELEGNEGGETGDTGETGDDPDRVTDDCTLEDDFCMGQDRLQSCDFSSGEAGIVDCGVLCGTYTNFTCATLGTGQHACWCVEAGLNKIDSCTQLEQCLADCGGGVTGACGEKCFGRTTDTTVRLYGALVYCAESECLDLCYESPQSCASCVSAAKQGLYGGCGVERSVCDADDNDEPDWP